MTPRWTFISYLTFYLQFYNYSFRSIEFDNYFFAIYYLNKSCLYFPKLEAYFFLEKSMDFLEEKDVLCSAIL